jgi:hypothetical protein
MASRRSEPGNESAVFCLFVGGGTMSVTHGRTPNDSVGRSADVNTNDACPSPTWARVTTRAAIEEENVGHMGGRLGRRLVRRSDLLLQTTLQKGNLVQKCWQAKNFSLHFVRWTESARGAFAIPRWHHRRTGSLSLDGIASLS